MSVHKVTPEEMLGGRAMVVSGNSPHGRLIKKYLDRKAESKERAAAARQFAMSAHGDQRYGDRPYVEHLTEVVDVLTTFGFSGDYVCAGWLHDVVEDTSVTVDDLCAQFGSDVADLVHAVSGGGDRDSHTAAIYEKIAAHPAAAVVKLADRIANVEACERGDKHARRYSREHGAFAAAVRPLVPPEMWRRYDEALRSRT